MHISIFAYSCSIIISLRVESEPAQTTPELPPLDREGGGLGSKKALSLCKGGPAVKGLIGSERKGYVKGSYSQTDKRRGQ